MRIITGSARGCRLKTPKGAEVTRPTADRVKESLFNILGNLVQGRKVLDVFAGTGNLGLEALSRGAEKCTFVDESREAVRLVKANLEKCGFSGTVIQGDALRFLEGRETYGLIFIDPPYRSGLYGEILQGIKHFDKLQTGGIMVVETPAELEPDSPGLPYVKLRSYRYGKVRITTFTRNEDEA